MNPIALIDPYGASAQLAVERKISPDLTCAIEAAAFFDYNPHLKAAPDESFTGYMLRLQAISWGIREGGVGIDVAYKHLQGTCRDSIKPDGVAPYSKDYELTRSVVIVRAYYVLRGYWGDHLSGDLYCGLGVRFKSSTSPGISGAERDGIDNHSPEQDETAVPTYKHEDGDHLYPDFVLGVRIGYAFN